MVFENSIHLWIGSNFSSEDEYMKYFELDYSMEGDFDDPNYNLCQFCEDIGLRCYDEDFIGIIPRHNENVSINEILADAAVDQSEFKSIKDICSKLGMKEANAIFWYQDSELDINPSYEIEYNGLKYIGLFEGD
ncbi:immunity 22 family protein [Xenorhabdus bovienii]|uniref:immunity 22 family protein n=1 Tax=Xenorhabdus bovienii TaxID=40576 RepID=UPI00237CFFF8|nr:immunity 22 family protein [Xenorhabdus bovienii]MDE1484010.1 immunity 22 family protein [Xenorhabdus bovienii]MDE9434263.1 immunity 22 family protein [Xenorhabdus bovienii]MDE9443056.1 immunity 22 family protein [Xenorhabdus bovienii]MDE9491894.1 immunity 22 family protein [Xenorhabdus bovienii]MDE9508270.1 immunity 22 family protein [Xenorhabdus bovienii]